MGFIMSWAGWFAGWIAVALEAVCIASLLYVAAEIAEESSALVRLLLRRCVGVVLILYTLLLLEGGPLKQIFMGIAAHASLLPLLRTFPFVEPFSFAAILPLVLLCCNHMLWFHYFLSHQSYRYSGADDFDVDVHEMGTQSVIGFFLVFVWVLPISFFVSMTEIDAALPSTTSANYGDPMMSSSGSSRKGNIFRRIMDPVLETLGVAGRRDGGSYQK